MPPLEEQASGMLAVGAIIAMVLAAVWVMGHLGWWV